MGLPSSKESACNSGDAGGLGSIPGSGRSPGGNGNPLQYSCLENPMDSRSQRVGYDWSNLACTIINYVEHLFLFLPTIYMSSLQKCLTSVGKEPTYNAGDPGLIPGLGRCPGEGKGYPLQYSGVEISMDWIVHGVAKSRTRLSSFCFHFNILTNLAQDKMRPLQYEVFYNFRK